MFVSWFSVISVIDANESCIDVVRKMGIHENRSRGRLSDGMILAPFAGYYK